MMMNMANNKFMNNKGLGSGHVNKNIMNQSQMSEYTSNNRQPYNDRQASTMTHVAKAQSYYESAMKSSPRQFASSLGPIPPKPNQTFQTPPQLGHIGNTRNQRNISFKEAWRKAIEKYSPKKPIKLNEVSLRFQQRVEEYRKVHNKANDIEVNEKFGVD